MALDEISKCFEIPIKKEKFKGLIGEGKLKDEKVLLLKPQTYMNLSGESIKQVVDFYKISLEKVIVIYDDIDIAEGKFKIRKKGSAGSHNGMKSIINNLGTEDFIRIRIGSSKPHENEDLADFILRGMSKNQLSIYEETLSNIVLAVKTAIIEGIDSAMNKFN